MSKTGLNANRRLVGTNNINTISPELDKINSTTQSATLFKAVVLEVIADPFSLTEDEIESIAQTVNNPELADIMPINSIIAKIISTDSGQSVNPNTILFPFYQSHIMLPINPGEVVYVIYEDLKGLGNKIGHWITRIHSPKTVEDVNYTHHDRKYDVTMNPAQYSTLDKKNTNEQVIGPDFQNGGGTNETFSISVSKKGENPYDTIFKQSKTKNLITPEPVPRWKKRPSEMVLQGSNNTLICLGEDRISNIDNNNDSKGQAGTIDIVVGRGREMPKTDSDEPINNAPRIIKNSRGFFETDKAPYRRNFQKKDNVNEGDPNFSTDASRLYISMQTNGDNNFGIEINSTDSLQLPQLPENGTFGKGFIVGKSDHIRFVARQDTEKNVNGTVLLIKEGEPDRNLGYFFIDENGNIQIEGPKIYSGKSTGETEPTVLYTNYQETINSLQNQINNLTSIIEQAFSSAIGNLGAPIPSLLTVGTSKTISSTNQTDKEKVLNNTKPEQHSLKQFNEPNPNRG